MLSEKMKIGNKSIYHILSLVVAIFYIVYIMTTYEPIKVTNNNGLVEFLIEFGTAIEESLIQIQIALLVIGVIISFASLLTVSRLLTIISTIAYGITMFILPYSVFMVSVLILLSIFTIVHYENPVKIKE